MPALAAMLLTSCSKVAQSGPDDAAGQWWSKLFGTKVKVHPAQTATQTAMRMYPALAVKDSPFNKTFRGLYAQELRTNSDLLTKPDWPLTLAQRTQQALTAPPPSVLPPPPTPQAVAVADDQTTPSSANPLNRGAYNKTQSRAYGGWTRYYPVIIQNSNPAQNPSH